MFRKTALIPLTALLLFCPVTALAVSAYENLSINYDYAVTKYDNAPDAEAHSAFINYVLNDEYWISQIKFSYLPEQNIQENSASTVRQKAYAAALEVLFKFNLGKKIYWGPRFDYAYHGTKSTVTTPSATTSLEDHADTLTGMVGIGYSFADKSDVTITYTYRDDFLSANENNTRPIGLELLHTLKNNYSLHLRAETFTENPDGVETALTVSVGVGTTF